MIKIVFTFLLLVCICGVSCNNTFNKKDAKRKLQDLFHMPISDSIEISDYNSSVSIQGDYTEIFVVHFRKDEFDKIFQKIKPSKFNNIDADIYGYSIEKSRERISAIFDPKKNIIKCTYNYE